MASPREKTTTVKTPDLVDVLDQISDIQVSATCARLILVGIQSIEAGSSPLDPLHGFLLRLEGEIDALKATADGMAGRAA